MSKLVLLVAIFWMRIGSFLGKEGKLAIEARVTMEWLSKRSPRPKVFRIIPVAIVLKIASIFSLVLYRTMSRDYNFWHALTIWSLVLVLFGLYACMLAWAWYFHRELKGLLAFKTVVKTDFERMNKIIFGKQDHDPAQS